MFSIQVLPLGLAYTMKQPQKLPGFLALSPKSHLQPHEVPLDATLSPLEGASNAENWSLAVPTSPSLILRQSQIAFF